MRSLIDQNYFTGSSIDEFLSSINKSSNAFTKNFWTGIKYTSIRESAHWTLSWFIIHSFQFEGSEFFWLWQLVFESQSNKIVWINMESTRERIPDLISFYILSVLSLLIVIFNIYAIFIVKKSILIRKWTKYIAIILLNFPSVIYNPVMGFDVMLLSFQWLWVSMRFGWYFDTVLSVGLPIGAIYSLWCVRRLRKINNC